VIVPSITLQTGIQQSRRNIMQNADMPGALPSLNESGDSSSLTREPTETLANNPTTPDQPVETLKGEPVVKEAPSPLQPGGTGSKPRTFLPRRGLYYAVIAGVIAGVFTALLTIVIILVNAGTFHAASLQIAEDRLTVKTALALVAWEGLTVALSLLACFFVGVIVGRIAVRRRLGFLTGALAGVIFYLITFLVSLISSYPGNLVVNRTPWATGSLVISFLLLCLWGIGGGLVSLFGTWVATVRQPHYMRYEQ
jgi:hypothetical protein